MAPKLVPMQSKGEAKSPKASTAEQAPEAAPWYGGASTPALTQPSVKTAAKIDHVEDIVVDGDVLLTFDEYQGNGEGHGFKHALRVSSAHLIVSSLIFRAMLKTHPTQESETLKKDGSVTIPLPDDNFEAFRIIMDVIHVRSNRVPKRTLLPVLTRIAVAVDKYEWHVAMAHYSEGWISGLRPCMSLSPMPELKQWTFIAWVFGSSEDFQDATGRIMTTAVESLDNADPALGLLPLPQVVIEELNDRRQKTLAVTRRTLELMAKAAEEFWLRREGSTFTNNPLEREEAAKLAGICRLEVRRMDLVDTKLKPAFPHGSVEDLQDMIQTISITRNNYLTWDDDHWVVQRSKRNKYNSNSYNHSYGEPEGIRDVLEQTLRGELEKLRNGLALEFFPRPATP